MEHLLTPIPFLTEIRDLCSKDGLSGKDRLFSTLFVQVWLGRQHTALCIFYAWVIQSNTACRALAS